jgi:hypothetical protein
MKTVGYRDHDWHAAHCSVVRNEQLQADGRGRGICDAGVPVLVVSNEDLGFPLCEMAVQPMPDAEVFVLDTMKRLCGTFPNITIIEKVPHSSTSIATEAGLDRRRVIRILNALLARGLVQKIERRGGWALPSHTTATGTIVPKSEFAPVFAPPLASV